MADQLLQLERRAQQVDDTNAPTILAIVGVFTGVALLIVALRGYVRARMLRAVGTDDYVIFTAMVTKHTGHPALVEATLTSFISCFQLESSSPSLAKPQMVWDDILNFSPQQTSRRSTIGSSSIRSL